MKPAKKQTPQNQLESETQLANSFEEDITPAVAAIIGMLITGLLYLALPPNVIFGPSWLLLAIEMIFLVPLTMDLLTSRWELPHPVKRLLMLIPFGIVTIALILGISLLIYTLPTTRYATNLLRSAALLWCFNILVFALWYWELDGGGPLQRHLSGHRAVDFLFPQQMNGQSWAPHFLDYLFLAFTSATAFSPADTLPLTKSAKMLMMVEALLSLAVIGVLVGRAVNILGG